MSPTILARAARHHYDELLAEAHLHRLRKEAVASKAPHSPRIHIPSFRLPGRG